MLVPSSPRRCRGMNEKWHREVVFLRLCCVPPFTSKDRRRVGLPELARDPAPTRPVLGLTHSPRPQRGEEKDQQKNPSHTVCWFNLLLGVTDYGYFRVWRKSSGGGSSKPNRHFSDRFARKSCLTSYGEVEQRGSWADPGQTCVKKNFFFLSDCQLSLQL